MICYAHVQTEKLTFRLPQRKQF